MRGYVSSNLQEHLSTYHFVAWHKNNAPDFSRSNMNETFADLPNIDPRQVPKNEAILLAGRNSAAR